MNKKINNALKYTILFILMIMIFGFITSVESEAASVPKATGTVNADGGIIIRSSYSTSSSSVGSIPDGTKVTLSKVKYTVAGSSSASSLWYYVTYAGKSGYIRSDLVTNETYSSIDGKTTTSVNYRKGADTTFAKVGVLSKSATVKITFTAIGYNNQTWYRILVGGQAYYIYGDYVSTATESDTPTNEFSNMTDAKFTAYLTNQGFSSSYRTRLLALHKAHPNWVFKAKLVGYSWSSALSKQVSSSNLIPSSYLNGYKDVSKGSYNFLSNYYIGKDSSAWVKGSKAAVAYFMDPRNWLTESGIFMFENLHYNSATVSSTMINNILAGNSALKGKASLFIGAGSSYNVSPVYLAAKSRIELGTYTTMVNGKYVINGKTGYYNAFNIGSYDSASGNAVYNGMKYAYNAGWTSLSKAINGGTKVIANGYINNNQHTMYYERFNAAKGLSYVGTHQYMTALTGPSSQSSSVTYNYGKYNAIKNPFVFEIPVYNSMPTSLAKKPTSAHNNCYLKSLSTTAGIIKTNLIICNSANIDTVYKTSFTVAAHVPYNTKSINISAGKSSSTASVTGTGNKTLSVGNNQLTVKCMAPSGVSRTYTINVNRSSYNAPEPLAAIKTQMVGNRQVKISWNSVPKATGYIVYYRKTSDSSWSHMDVSGTSCTTPNLTTNATCQFKVIPYRKVTTSSDSYRLYASAYSPTNTKRTFGTTPSITVDLYSGYRTPKISWSKVTGASGYRVYYRQTGTSEWNRIDTTSTYIVKTMDKEGTKYEYKILPYYYMNGTRYYSGDYSTTKTLYTLKKIDSLLVSRQGLSTAKLLWINIPGETGYQIYRSTSINGTYTKVKTIGSSYRSWTDSGLNSNKIYYYKIRAYKSTQYGTKVYGSFSNPIRLDIL